MNRVPKNFYPIFEKRRINMKHSVTKIFILAVFFASAMILGCGEGEKPPETTIQEKQEEAKEEIKEIQEEGKEEVKEIQEEVKKETGDVVDSVTEFTIEKKEEYTTAKLMSNCWAWKKNSRT
jgi:gas vesicle protein